jgi:hypothetical protein
MSDEIRNAIIKLGIQLTTPDLKLPSLEPAIKQQEKLAEAIKATEAATAKAAESSQTSTESTAAEVDAVAKSAGAANAAEKATIKLEVAKLRASKASDRLAESSLGVAKGFVLLAAGTSGSLSTILPYAFAIEGLIGLTKSLNALNDARAAAFIATAKAEGLAAAATVGITNATRAFLASIGPVGWVLIAAAAAAFALSKAYDALTTSDDEAAEASAKHRAEIDATVSAMEALNEQSRIHVDSALAQIDHLDTLAEKQKALAAAVRSRANIEMAVERAKLAASGMDPSEGATLLDEQNALLNFQVQTHDKLINAAREENEEKRKAVKSQIDLVKEKEKELIAARKTLEVEESKRNSLAASLGLLTKGEQRKLEKARAAAESGTASRSQLLDLQRFGGDVGQAIAEKLAAPLGTAMRDALEGTGKKLGIADPRGKAQAEFNAAQAASAKANGGKATAAALADLQQENDALVAGFTELQKTNNEMIRFLLQEQKTLQQEVSRQKQAAQAANAARAK